MKIIKKIVLVALLSILAIMLLRELKSQLLFQNIETMTVSRLIPYQLKSVYPKKIRFTKEKNSVEIMKFIRVFHRVRHFRDDIGTTPPVTVCLTLRNGAEIYVSGGSQGFQTVYKKDKGQINSVQYNVSGDDLNDYLESYLP